MASKSDGQSGPSRPRPPVGEEERLKAKLDSLASYLDAGTSLADAGEFVHLTLWPRSDIDALAPYVHLGKRYDGLHKKAERLFKFSNAAYARLNSSRHATETAAPKYVSADEALFGGPAETAAPRYVSSEEALFGRPSKTRKPADKTPRQPAGPDARNEGARPGRGDGIQQGQGGGHVGTGPQYPNRGRGHVVPQYPTRGRGYVGTDPQDSSRGGGNDGTASQGPNSGASMAGGRGGFGSGRDRGAPIARPQQNPLPKYEYPVPWSRWMGYGDLTFVMHNGERLEIMDPALYGGDDFHNLGLCDRHFKGRCDLTWEECPLRHWNIEQTEEAWVRPDFLECYREQHRISPVNPPDFRWVHYEGEPRMYSNGDEFSSSKKRSDAIDWDGLNCIDWDSGWDGGMLR